MAMEFYIMNQSLVLLGVIDTYKSAIWTRRYYSAGDFELYVPASEANMDLLKEGYFIVRVDDSTKGGIIDAVKINTDAEEGNYITATGKTLSSLLSRRIMWKQTRYSGMIEKALRRMVYDHCISPEIAARAIPNLILGAEAGITLTFAIQMTGDNIGTGVGDICKTYGLGYDIEFNMEERKFEFIIYKGTDRSYNQTENPYVVFSPDYENIISSEYSNDVSAFKTTAQVAGEGEGVDRVKIAIGNTVAGLARFELFVDARDLSSNSGELTASEYRALLEQRGRDKLAELGITEKVNSEVAASQTFQLGRDYFIGDIVEIINEYGIAMTPRVTEVIECQDDTGYTCIPTFSTEE